MKIEPVAWKVECECKKSVFDTDFEAYVAASEWQDDGYNPVITILYALPPDHVIVPREPTEAMVYGMSRILDTDCMAYAKQMCKNVIEAAGVDDE